MPKNPSARKKVKKLAASLGVVRISHRRPVRTEVLLEDLKRIGARLGRPTRRPTRKSGPEPLRKK